MKLTCIDLSENRPIDPSAIPATVLALGNFDGVHLGHRELLRTAVARAEALTREGTPAAAGVWLFRAPPTDLLRDPPIPHLSTLDEKLALFRAAGIRYAFLGDFTVLASLSPEDFARRVLREECRCVHAVCGFNYSFGHRGSGTPDLLGELLGGAVTVIDPVLCGGLPVSSTRIRELLSDGAVADAARLLGRPYSLTAPVLHGKALGRTIGFPTANQNFPPLAAVPKYGIYAVEVRFPEEDPATVRYGVANVGTRPTVEDAGHVNCETFLLDFCGDLYGKTVETRFIEFLRPERKMSGIEELREAIRNDEKNARRVFGLGDA